MSEETHLIIFEYEPVGRNREPVHTSTYDIRGILSDGSALRILQSFPPPASSTNTNTLEDTWSEFEDAYLTRPGFVEATCLVQVHSLAPQDSEIVADLKERLAETGEEVIYLNATQAEEKEEEVLNTYTFVNPAGIKQPEKMSSTEEPSVENKNVKLHSKFETFLNKQLHVPRIIRRGEHEYDVLFAYNLNGSVSHYNTEYSDRIIAKGYKTRRNKGKKSRHSVRGKGKKTRGKKLRQRIKY
jgi:hypothetical protein